MQYILDMMIKKIFSNIDKIKFTELPGPHNDWGHTPRQFGLDNASEEWVVMSGDDNYYTPNFVSEFTSKMDNTTNFIYCDMLHNHFKYSYREYFRSSYCLINKKVEPLCGARDSLIDMLVIDKLIKSSKKNYRK